MQARLLRVYGIVQGVGFRPFVARLAARERICGAVANKGSYVEIIAEGEEAALARFQAAVRAEAPERAAVIELTAEKIAPQGAVEFVIAPSEHEEGAVFVSPDIATCPRCAAELFDKKDRRYLHPFINCTACGPRLTILEAMPYDRERTSMKEFPMCPACRAEYDSPASRRYDAQPVACHDCGPEVYVLEGDGQSTMSSVPSLPRTGEGDRRQPVERGTALEQAQESGFSAVLAASKASSTACGGPPSPEGKAKALRQSAAITAVRRVLAGGGIAAIKGIGGFHLCCDATNEAAVQRLRELKHRPMKPFAVMARDLNAVAREVRLSAAAEELLQGAKKPILLLPRQAGGRIAPAVAPDNSRVGIMLPYAPLHYLLFSYPDGLDEQMPDALVMTSGNPSGAPLCRTDEEAAAVLGPMSDIILSHNRRIRLRADDSVLDYADGSPVMVRRSRGYAPLPFHVSGGWQGAVLGIGGELKNTFCLAKDELFYPSAYIGDMSDVRTVQALEEAVPLLESLLEIKPAAVACDLHPRYNTTLVAEQLGLPVVRVQHHYAHILSCMAENNYLAPVIGVALDGTGYGTDGTVWGGEILRADMQGFTRLGSITPFCQAGGDLSSREGWRIAANLLHSATGDAAETLRLAAELELGKPDGIRAQLFMEKNKINAVTSTSTGRLFDAVSAVLGLRRQSSFEGEAAMVLQHAAEEWEASFTACGGLLNAGAICTDSNSLPLGEGGPRSGSDEGLSKVGGARESSFSAESAASEASSTGYAGPPSLSFARMALTRCCASRRSFIIGSFADPEGKAEGLRHSGAAWDLAQAEDGRFLLPTTALFADIVQRRLQGESTPQLAYEFHAGLAAQIVTAIQKAQQMTGLKTVALSGGTWQNTLLSRLVKTALEAQGLTVLTHHLCPPNDGGLCLGQAVYAMGQVQNSLKEG